ncbi:hypothetical protein TNCT_199871 [Trichonephila clavata]|uniref:Uncharacterized protein n=1 Tax=Trichonephila clavata TaxID=2740835 RepID=A0A8X6JHD5_TRICU|nr:hypothetical protein TNCT_199871 [Trichonephila clavata]
MFYRFSVTNDSGPQLLWRDRGTCYAQRFVCERDPYDPGVMICSGIMHNDRTPLHIFERGTTLQRTILDNDSIF